MSDRLNSEEMFPGIKRDITEWWKHQFFKKIWQFYVCVYLITEINYIKQKLIELQREIEKSTMIAGDYNTPLSITDITGC